MNGREKGERKIHPALDFLDSFAVVGIVDAQHQVWLVDSRGQQHSSNELHKPGAFSVAPFAYEGVVDR